MSIVFRGFTPISAATDNTLTNTLICVRARTGPNRNALTQRLCVFDFVELFTLSGFLWPVRPVGVRSVLGHNDLP